MNKTVFASGALLVLHSVLLSEALASDGAGKRKAGYVLSGNEVFCSSRSLLFHRWWSQDDSSTSLQLKNQLELAAAANFI